MEIYETSLSITCPDGGLVLNERVVQLVHFLIQFFKRSMCSFIVCRRFQALRHSFFCRSEMQYIYPGCNRQTFAWLVLVVC